jgi:hypothetical protein
MPIRASSCFRLGHPVQLYEDQNPKHTTNRLCSTAIKPDSRFDACTGLEIATMDFKRPHHIFADARYTDKSGLERNDECGMMKKDQFIIYHSAFIISSASLR